MFVGVSTALTAVRAILKSFITDGLKLFYNFRDNSPDFLLDGSTSFDGSNDYIQIADTDNLSFGDGTTDSAFSLSAWVKIPNGTDTIPIFHKYSSSKLEYRFINHSSGLIFNTFDQSSSGYIGRQYGTAITAYNNQWIHLVGTYSGNGANSGFKIYLNGSRVDDTNFGAGSYTAMENLSENLEIGRDNGSTYGEFSMANGGIWNRELSASEVESIYWRGSYSELKDTELTNLVSWYNLQGDVLDSAGSNNGTNNGATLNSNSYSGGSPFKPRVRDLATPSSTDPLNFGEVYSMRALDFDGSNDYVDCGDGTSLDITSNLSISFWAKFDDVSTTQFLIGRDNDTQRNFELGISSTRLFWSIYSGGSAKGTGGLGNALSVGIWYHIVATYDGSNLKTYVDGLLTSTTAGTGAIDNDNVSFTIGAREGGMDRHFNGKMSSVKVFNTALTQDEVRSLYTSPEIVIPNGVSSSSLKLDLPMQEGSGSYIYDGSGNQNHGTITGATWATGEQYGYQSSLVRSNTPMIFDGSNDHVVIADNNSLSFGDGSSDSPFSISAWIFMNDATNFIIFTKGVYNTTTAEYNFMVNGSDRLSLELYDESLGSTYQLVASSDQLTTYQGKWVHVAVTYTGVGGTSAKNGIKLYLNASELSVTTASNGSYVAMENLTADVHIGRYNTSYANGIINEVGLWNVALDADAVTALYNSGTPLDVLSDSGNYDNSSALQGYWRNDGNITWTDRSTNSNNGTASGSPVTIVIPEGSTEGRDNQGYYLSDTTAISNGIRFYQDGYIKGSNLSDMFKNVANMSVSVWVYPQHSADAGDDYYSIINQWDHNTSTMSWGLWLKAPDNSTDAHIHWNDGTAVEDGSATVLANEWSHIAVTKSGTTVKLYHNGSEVHSGTGSSTTGNHSEDLLIGVQSESSKVAFFNGKIDDLFLYLKALSASEVLKNYNSGKSSHS